MLAGDSLAPEARLEMLGATDKDIATAYIVGYWDRPSNQDAVRGTTRYAAVHTSARTSQGTAPRVTWHGMVGQRRRLVQGVWDHHQVRFTQWQSPFEGGGPWYQQPPSCRDGIRWFLVFHHGREGGCVWKEESQTESTVPVEAEWGAKERERRRTRKSMDQTFERGVVMPPCQGQVGGLKKKKHVKNYE